LFFISLLLFDGTRLIHLDIPVVYVRQFRVSPVTCDVFGGTLNLAQSQLHDHSSDSIIWFMHVWTFPHPFSCHIIVTW